MPHKPLYIKDLALSFPHKVCFEDFTATIHPGQKIAVIGNNGSGKSTLLKILQGIAEPTGGEVCIPDDVLFGYVPQVIEEHENLSGGQRLNAALTQALCVSPNILFLDEPTNHLDSRNRKSLMRMLQNFAGTEIIVSHDGELLRQCVDTLWHIEGGKVHVFQGSYEDYRAEKKIQRGRLEKDLATLKDQKKEAHTSLMKEQEKAHKRKMKGEKKIANKRWMKSTADLKIMGAEKSQGRKFKEIDQQKKSILSELSNLRIPEKIVPTFTLPAGIRPPQTLVHIDQGSTGYEEGLPVLSGIYLTVQSGERIAIQGDNGSGKSTLVRGILDDPAILKTGTWTLPHRDDIGYLDQHYTTLEPHKSVLETIADLAPTLSHAEIRRHLNDFLFRKNDEVYALVRTLSGGEKARLSLAQIAAQTPKLLILDEITNNLDLETKDHVIQVLKAYPGAMIVISHDRDFLDEIGITRFYDL